MPIKLILVSEQLGDEGLRNFTQEICSDLSQVTGFTVSIPEKKAGPGAKGDLIASGEIWLAAISAGGVLTVLAKELGKAILAKAQQNKTIKFIVENEKGGKLEFEGKNLNAKELQDVTSKITNHLSS